MDDLKSKKLLRGEEVAEALNISLPFAYKLMKSGQIKTVKLGRCVRVIPEDLDAFIEACSNPPVKYNSKSSIDFKESIFLGQEPLTTKRTIKNNGERKLS